MHPDQYPPHGPQQGPQPQPPPYNASYGAPHYPPGTPYPPMPGAPLGPPPPKKRNGGKIAALIIAAVVLVCLGGVVIAVATSGGNTTTSATTPHSGAAAGTAPAGSAPPVALKPKTLLSAKGNGIKKTALFTTPDEWTLKYSFTCAGFGGTGNFIVSEYNDSGDATDVLVNELSAKGADTVPQHADPGKHYLEVNSECSWTISVTG